MEVVGLVCVESVWLEGARGELTAWVGAWQVSRILNRTKSSFDIFCDHLPLAFFDEECGACL